MTDPIAPAAGGQGTPVTPSAEPTPISSAPAPGTVPAAPAAPATWYEGFDPDMRGWMENKGLTKMDASKALEVALNGHRNLEKHMGVPADKLLRLPDFDKADKGELDQFYNKLGRPADISGYEIPVPQGISTDFADAAKVKFHELGFTALQAKELVAWNNEYLAGAQAKQQEAYAQTIAQENEALKKEWGAAYEQELGMAKNAAKALGIPAEQIDKLEGSLGFANLMKMMANIGRRIGEDKYIDGGAASSGAMTPVGAQARIKQLQGDKEWTAKYLSGNVQARAEMERLMQFAYPS